MAQSNHFDKYKGAIMFDHPKGGEKDGFYTYSNETLLKQTSKDRIGFKELRLSFLEDGTIHLDREIQNQEFEQSTSRCSMRKDSIKTLKEATDPSCTLKQTLTGIKIKDIEVNGEEETASQK